MAKLTEVHLFLDGPKSEEDIKKQLLINQYFDKASGFLGKEKHVQKRNLGLKQNILYAINYIINRYGKGIFLEDDIITSRYFLDYMNSGLKIYENVESVCQISGYSYLEKYFPADCLATQYFLKGGDCLAWGTWRRAWREYDDNATDLRLKIDSGGKIREFNRGGSYPFYKLLQENITRQNSWAINWYASTFLSNRYTLYPRRSLAVHITSDEGATNYRERFDDPLTVSVSNAQQLATWQDVREELQITLYYKDFLRALSPPLLTKLVVKFRKVFGFISR